MLCHQSKEFAMKLSISDKMHDEIKNVLRYAERNVYSASRLRRIIENKENMPRDDLKHCCILDHDFHCVYSIEERRYHEDQPRVWCKHLCISSVIMPNEDIIEEIIKLFGFKQNINECSISLKNERTIRFPTIIDVFAPYDLPDSPSFV